MANGTPNGAAPMQASPRRGGARRIAIAEWAVAALGVAYLLAYASFYIPAHSFLPDAGGSLAGGDFKVFWAAARLVAEGRVAELYDIRAFGGFQAELLGEPWRAERFTPFPYPPHALILFLPLAVLPYGAALGLWLAAGCVLFVLAGGAGRPRSLAVLLLGAPALTIALVAGQTGLFSAALLIGGIRLMGARPVLAGILFGLLTFKPHFGLLIPVAVLAGGHWRSFLAAAATAVLLAVAGAVLFGAALWPDYLQFSQEMGSGYLAELTRTEGPGFGGMHASVFSAVYSLGAGFAAAGLAQAAAAIAAAAAVAVAWRRADAAPWRLPLIATLAFAASPYAFVYDMPLLAFAVAAAGGAMVRSGLRPGELLALAAVWVLPVAGPPVIGLGVPIAPLAVAGLAFVLWRRTATPALTPGVGAPAEAAAPSHS